MWQALVEQISAELGADFQLTHKQQLPLRGQHLRFQLQGKVAGQDQQFFIKLGAHADLEQFTTEAHSLRAIRQRQCIRTPDVVAVAQTLDHSMLVLEYLPMTSDHPYGWQALGHQLAFLHLQHEQAMYGFDWDNFSSDIPQPNRWQSSWASFFAEQRLGWILQLLKEQSHPLLHNLNIDHAVQQAKQLLHHHQPAPSLVHGEFCAENIGFIGETPVLFDPACFYGDREMDIAYARLQPALPENFFNAYAQIAPLPDGHQQRKPLYDLYHLLVFTYRQGSQQQQAQALLQQLLTQN